VAGAGAALLPGEAGSLTTPTLSSSTASEALLFTVIGALIIRETARKPLREFRPRPEHRRLRRAWQRPRNTLWDIGAAKRAGVHSIGVLSGGTSAAELSDAGAATVYADAAALLEGIENTPLGEL
jgi:hypothetical protein